MAAVRKLRRSITRARSGDEDKRDGEKADAAAVQQGDGNGVDQSRGGEEMAPEGGGGMAAEAVRVTGVEPHAGEEGPDPEQQGGCGEGRAFAEIEERAVARHPGKKPGEVRGGGSEGIDRSEDQASGQEGGEGQAESLIPGDHGQGRGGETEDRDEAFFDVGLRKHGESENHDAEAESGGEDHRRQGHPALQGEIPGPPPGDAGGGKRDERQQGEAAESGQQPGEAGHQDDQADGDEDLREATEELERFILGGQGGAFAGAVVYQGLQRGGLCFAKNSGSDGGAKIFWSHSDGASARNGPFRDKGFVGANQVR
jgi:hypothetical protein